MLNFRCYNEYVGNISKPNEAFQTNNCLSRPGKLLRQKSFHTLQELRRLCHVKYNKNANHNVSNLSNQRYSIDDNVLSNNICDETTEVKLRHQVDSDTKNSNETFLTKDKIVHCINNNNNNIIIIHQHQHQHNNQKILHLAEIAKVATIHTRSSCPSTVKYTSSMKNFQMPHAITATTARISEKITASSSARKFMKDFNEMPENKNDRNNTKIAEVTIIKEKSSNSINAKNAKMSADVENSISTHVHSKGTNSGTHTNNNNNNNNNHNKNNNNNINKKNNNNNNISKNNLSIQPITTTTESTTESTTTTTSAKVVSRTKGGGNTPHRGKMSKKQLKLAQAQLDKLTQINLHQHGNPIK